MEDHTIRQITGVIVRVRNDLCAHDAIKDKPDALAAVIGVCDNHKDNVQRPWSARAARGDGRII